jgi:hypothetical protein
VEINEVEIKKKIQRINETKINKIDKPEPKNLKESQINKIRDNMGDFTTDTMKSRGILCNILKLYFPINWKMDKFLDMTPTNIEPRRYKQAK